jgi:hypothetical protein
VNPAVGTELRLRRNLGDCNRHTNESVVVPAGTPATLKRYFRRAATSLEEVAPSEPGLDYAEIAIPTSPGQKQLTTQVSELHLIWHWEKGRSRWRHILGDEDGDLHQHGR